MSISLHRTAPRIAALALAAAVPLSLAACSGSTPSSSPTSSSSVSSGVASPSAAATSAATSAAPSESATPSATPSTAAADAAFGPGCSKIPNTGTGSLTEMAQAPVATAASGNPLLSTLVTAVKTAGLTDTLNNAKNITVFAPANAAFADISRSDLTRLLANRSKLTGVLTYHVVGERLSPADLAGTHKTLNGKSLTVTGSGESFTVNGDTKVICGNIQTANATVYVIDGVLMPPS